LIGPLNLFHVLSGGLVAYGWIYWRRSLADDRRGAGAQGGALSVPGQTTSLCETCLGLVPAKVIAEDDNVFYLKRCREHGVQKTLIADDLGYWKSQQDWLKPGDRPLSVATRTEPRLPLRLRPLPRTTNSTPCLAIIEVNEACNLSCPVCFADSSIKRTAHRPLAEIEAMWTSS
jgi:uncharacterized radical SAM superfamily Fe-S cluster-containing enzyme